MASVPASHRKSVSAELHHVQEPDILDASSASPGSSKHQKPVNRDRGMIDTAAPFGSVKEAVSKFGRIVDWNAQKSVSLERHRGDEDELGKIQGKLLEMKKQADDAADSKRQVLEELESTQRLLEELKPDLERAREEETLAKQVAIEIKQGITEDATLPKWNMKLEIVEAEIDELNERLSLFKDMESKLDLATTLLLNLKAELATKGELEEAKKNIKESEVEVSRLKVAASCLKSELETETTALAVLRKKQEEASLVVSSLEAELARAQTELHLQDPKEIESMVAKSAIVSAPEEEVEPAAATTFPLEKYHSPSERARTAEEVANERVRAAVEQINEANVSKFRSLEMLEEANRELEEKKEALRKAVKAFEEANEGKLGAEQELRMWRAENERKRRAQSDCLGVESLQSSSSSGSEENEMPNDSIEEEEEEEDPSVSCYHIRSPSAPCTAEGQDSDSLSSSSKPRRKKAFFPRVVMFLARKKVQSLK